MIKSVQFCQSGRAHLNISIDTWEVTIVAISITLLLFIIGLHSKRQPNLIIIGGGGGPPVNAGDQDVSVVSIDIINMPTFSVMKADRGSAVIDYVRIFDPILEKYIGPYLLWSVDGSQDLFQSVMIKSGEEAHLNVFAKSRQSDEYFILSGKDLSKKLSLSDYKYDEIYREFSIHLFNKGGVIKKFDFNARNQKGVQHLGLIYKKTLDFRIELIKSAFIELREAFSIK